MIKVLFFLLGCSSQLVWAERYGTSTVQASFKVIPEQRTERDEFGNAIGGIRVPELEAPIASYRGERTGGLGNPNWLSGETKPFDESVLNKLYPRENDRATRWNQAVDQLVKQGLVLPEDVQSLRSRGFSSDPFA